MGISIIATIGRTHKGCPALLLTSNNIRRTDSAFLYFLLLIEIYATFYSYVFSGDNCALSKLPFFKTSSRLLLAASLFVEIEEETAALSANEKY